MLLGKNYDNTLSLRAASHSVATETQWAELLAPFRICIRSMQRIRAC